MSQGPAEKHEQKAVNLEMTTLTVLFLILWFLMRLANHDRAVWPVLNLLGSGEEATASAIIGLFSVRARSSLSLLGRLKKTSDQRSYAAWSLGGGLHTNETLE